MSEAEKALFRKVDEISEEFEKTGKVENLAESYELVCKNIEVMLLRTREMYCNVVPNGIAGLTALDKELVNYFFQLHFRNFEFDLFECVKKLLTWKESDVQEFLVDLKKYGPFYFRIPRGFNDPQEMITSKSNSEEAQKVEDKNSENREGPSSES